MEATYRTMEGVELRLLNGRVIHVPALTVAEAMTLLRQLAAVADDPGAHVAFLSTFPTRTGLIDERLDDIGLVVDGIEGFGGLTLRDGLALVEVYGLACADAYELESTAAKVRVLDEFPPTFGLDADDATPSEVFALARSFAENLYLLIYGLAQDFSQALTASPPVKALTLRAQEKPTSRPGSAT